MVGTTVLTSSEVWGAAVLLLPTVSVKAPAATSTVMFVVEFASGVINKVYRLSPVSPVANVPAFIPPTTVMSEGAKVELPLLKVKV